ncbi:hypothetical protein ColTof4_12977 [Colletotrichum tofieldiae]|nr:hypothetical protein ColTof4_12977 [Colletotrichum tofieldiae]GKT88675.1 hypothetical protein Ct61P_06525 [Colletotrichum tofieldiae]
MYHHAEDLRRAQHIVEHLAAGLIPNEGTTQPPQDDVLRVTTPSVENILSQVDSSGLNREKLECFDMALADDREHSRAWNVHDLERSQSFDVDPVKKGGSGSTPVRAGGRLASSPSWLKSPNQMKSRLVTMETRSTPQMEDEDRNNSAAMSPPLGPEVTTSPASAVSLHSTKSSSQLLQTQSEQYGPPKNEPAIQWPKLKKVVRKTTSEADKELLPWMKKPLRRVQKEENMSQQAREQNSAHVESWRLQLRKTQVLDADSPGGQHGEDANYGDRKRTDTCLTCRHETPSPPVPLANAIETTPNIPTKPSREARNAEHEDQDGELNILRQKRLEEARFSSSQRSTSRTLATTKVELDTVTHIYQANGVVHSTLESLAAEETSIDSVEEAGEEPSRNCTDKIEVLSPIPIMPPNHTCFWKERYLNLTAEVRQLKAEMVSPERHNTSEHVDVGTKTSQGDDYELGVEGLTIVMHLKGKDDLIINTDLTQASSDI